MVPDEISRQTLAASVPSRFGFSSLAFESSSTYKRQRNQQATHKKEGRGGGGGSIDLPQGRSCGREQKKKKIFQEFLLQCYLGN